MMDSQRLAVTISEAKAGSPEAYQTLLATYGRRLYGYFLRACRSHHDAEDLLGELMLRLVQTLGSYEEQGRFEPWLFRIAANMVRDRIRRGRATPAVVSLDEADGSADAPCRQVQCASPSVDAGLQAAEASARLAMALERLDEPAREMILLRHFGRMSFKELAERFDCPLGTALARVHRGLRLLRKLMGDENDA